MKRLDVVLAFLILFLAGCAYTPMVDTSAGRWTGDGHVKVDTLESDLRECAAMSGIAWKDVLSTGVLGGSMGAGMGAAAGAMLGGSMTILNMTPAGAVMFGIPALAYGVFKGIDDSHIAFRTCLSGRGYSVVQ